MRFHDVWRRASGYDPVNGAVLGWIMNQARSRAIDRLRFDQRKKRVDPHAGDAQPFLETGDSHDLLELTRQRAALQRALSALTPDERRAMETTFFSQMTHAEAAERLDQPLGTIKKLHSGDYSRAEPGTSDKRVWSETGCTCVLVTSTVDRLS